MTDENTRIRFLVERDGHAAAREWIERTLRIYREAIDSPGSHASAAHYRPRFEDAIAEFEHWLREQDADDGPNP